MNRADLTIVTAIESLEFHAEARRTRRKFLMHRVLSFLNLLTSELYRRLLLFWVDKKQSDGCENGGDQYDIQSLLLFGADASTAGTEQEKITDRPCDVDHTDEKGSADAPHLPN